MNNNWLRIEFYPTNDTQENRERIVSTIIKEIVIKLDSSKEKYNFYFSYQSDYVLLYISMETQLANTHLVPLLKKAKTEDNMIKNCEWKEDDQKGNIEFYKESWELTVHFMEAISKLVMGFIIEKEKPKRSELLCKYAHLLLNTAGYNWLEESQFHHMAAYNMLENCFDLTSAAREKLNDACTSYNKCLDELYDAMSEISSGSGKK